MTVVSVLSACVKLSKRKFKKEKKKVRKEGEKRQDNTKSRLLSSTDIMAMAEVRPFSVYT